MQLDTLTNTANVSYYRVGSLLFNTSHPLDATTPASVLATQCQDTFNAIVSACLYNAQSSFWGGWFLVQGLNYSIANIVFPANPLPSAQPVVEISDGQPQNPGPTTPGVITVGSMTITANPTGFTIGTATIKPGGPPVTISGDTFSLGSSSNLIVDGSTTILTGVAGAGPTTAKLPPGVIIIGSLTITADPTGFHIGTATLKPGGPPITTYGDTYSLGSSSNLIIDGSTTTLPAAPGSTAGSGTQSSITGAFAISTQSVTTLTVDGSTEVYSKETIASLSSITSITTITTDLTETNSNGKTYTITHGTIIVGPHGIWWNGGGIGFGITGPSCIWPFCPPGGGGDVGGSGSGENPDDPNTPKTQKITSQTGTKASKTSTKSSSSASSTTYPAASPIIEPYVAFDGGQVDAQAAIIASLISSVNAAGGNSKSATITQGHEPTVTLSDCKIFTWVHFLLISIQRSLT